MFITSFYFPSATGIFFGLLFFISWIGYGYLLVILARPTIYLHWGLLACLGISVLILIGGVEALLGVVSNSHNIYIVIVGWVFFLLWLKSRIKAMDTFKNSLKIRNKSDVFYLSLFVIARIFVLTILVIHLAGSMLPTWWDECDDWLAYLYFPKKLIETGSLIEPFNLRRMSTLGGGVYLQSFMYPIFGLSAVSFTDVGLGKVLLWSVLLSFPNRIVMPLGERLKKEIVAISGLILSLSLITYNHSSVYLPYVLLLSFLFINFLILQHKAEASLANLVIISVVAAASITFRNNLVTFIFGFALIQQVLSFSSTMNIYRNVANFIVHILLILLFVTPWLILSFKSSGTIFYPVFKGYYNFPFEISMPLTLIENIYFVFDNLSASKSLILFGLFLVAFISKNHTRYIFSIMLAAILSIIALSMAMTASDSYSIVRYSQSFLYSGIAASSYILFFCCDSKTLRSNALIVLMILCWLFWPSTYTFKGLNQSKETFSNSALITYYMRSFNTSYKNVTEKNLNVLNTNNSKSYREVQQSLVEKAKVLSVTAQPYYWDFSKQEIYTLDCIGQVSPPPGLPFFKGPDAMSSYFKQHGYRYIAYSPFDSQNCLYSTLRWETLLKGDVFIWSKWAPYFLDFFKNIKELEMRRSTLILKNKKLTVIDLQSVR